MDISVFKNIGFPKDKEDKINLSKYAFYGASVLRCDDIKTMQDHITKYAWSPSIFDGVRKKCNFKYSDFLVLDIDKDLTINQALDRVANKLELTCICLPTVSHTSEHNKFRLIFPLDTRIDSNDVFEYNMEYLNDLFPEADRQCITDSARFFFPCKLSDDGFICDGNLYSVKIPPVKINNNISHKQEYIPLDMKDIVNSIYKEDRDTAPSCVIHFLSKAHTGLDGEWICSLNAFVFSLSISGLAKDQVYDIIKQIAPEDLDTRDIKTIENAYKDGILKR